MKAMKAIKVTTDNVVSVLSPDMWRYRCVFVSDLKKEVGGYLEIVRPKGLAKPFVMLVDEEGLLKEKPLNTLGSLLYGTQEHGNPIVGDILFVREEEGPEGYDLYGLSDSDIVQLETSFNNIFEILKKGVRS